MEGQTIQETTPEHVVDDPLAPLRLPPLAQTGDFWKRYDRLADIHDKRMTSNLNGNLDVLLIFAALFSAINTTFITITMPDLSPNPSDETNTLLRLLVMKADNNTLTAVDLSPSFSPNSTSIVVNCLLYASLSCSLLAAVGAMMSKEWLQSFDRTGQTGPLEEQGRFRQRKFNGVEGWHLEAVIKFLPNLLLLSVILFFAGIGLFLLPINTAVAGIVIAFSGLGLILSGMSVIAGALSPLCPYQSAASGALLRTARGLLSLWGAISLANFLRIMKSMTGLASKLFEIMPHQWIHWPRGSSPTPPLPDSEDTSTKIVAAQAAYWLLQTTSNRGDQISAAMFIRTLDEEACMLAFKESGSSRRLLSLALEALEVWYNQRNSRNQEIAELFGLASCHVRLQISEDDAQRNDLGNLRVCKGSTFGEIFLGVLELTTARYAIRGPEDEEYILHISFLSAIVIKRSCIQEYPWSDLSRLCFTGNTRNTADILLGIWAIFAAEKGRATTHSDESYTLGELLAIGEDREFLAKVLASAISRSRRALSSVQKTEVTELARAVQGYTACLRKTKELHPFSEISRIRATRGVAELIWGYFDFQTMWLSGRETRSALVRLSVEAVLALRAFLDTNPYRSPTSGRSPSQQVLALRAFLDTNPYRSPNSGHSPSQQVLDGRFVDAVVDILDNPKTLTSGPWEDGLVKRSIIKILLWVWKNSQGASTGDPEKAEIFVSSCRLFAPLEKEVEFSQRGKFDTYDNPLTSFDLDKIIEFIEYIMKDRNSSAFITRNADVGINRLYVHVNKRVDWKYELFDLHEQHSLCSRSTFIESRLL